MKFRLAFLMVLEECSTLKVIGNSNALTVQIETTGPMVKFTHSSNYHQICFIGSIIRILGSRDFGKKLIAMVIPIIT